VVAGVSTEQELEVWLTFPRFIDSETFISFLETLLAATIHRKKKVVEFFKAHSVQVIFYVAY
jgi:hypothetical protein